MRYDIRLMWVEDMPKWYNETREIIEMDIEDECLSADINYINDGQELLQKLQREQEGFKLYDIFFIDYSLSNGILGSSIIKELRKTNIDSDILFYSSNNEELIRKAVIDDLGSFEGVYIANRDNFREKCLFLIKKNSKKLLSLSNIRGLLADQTSENDFIVKSYLYKKYNKLNDTQKEEIKNMVLEDMISRQNRYVKANEKEIERIEKNGISNINKLLSSANFIVPIELKYKMFDMIIQYSEETIFEKYTIENYIQKIIKLRNNVSHKKLDICRMQKYILYYDNINQFCNRQCPINCEEHTDGNKISVQEWMDIRKQVLEYGEKFDLILNRIMAEININEEEVAVSAEE